MMQLEASPPDRARVIGALTGAALETLFEMVKAREVRLDLSQVSEADVEALPYDRKSVSGIPFQGPAGQPVDLAAHARVARGRLWPSTLVYGIGSAVVIALAVGRHGLRACLPWVAAGILIWTWAEYLAHRFVLHGIFPNGSGWWRQLLHRKFDHLHWHHHQEPWNGRHINGTLRDTGPFVAVLAALAAVAPRPAGPVLVAAFVLGYVIEEWVHLSVHFAGWSGRYFRYIRRHHMYHHGARGRDLAFGLTSDAWDLMYGTQARIPADRGGHRPRAEQTLATR